MREKLADVSSRVRVRPMNDSDEAINQTICLTAKHLIEWLYQSAIDKLIFFHDSTESKVFIGEWRKVSRLNIPCDGRKVAPAKTKNAKQNIAC